jgi:hypothetical protein
LSGVDAHKNMISQCQIILRQVKFDPLVVCYDLQMNMVILVIIVWYFTRQRVFMSSEKTESLDTHSKEKQELEEGSSIVV